jgi:hypothetical protein
MSGAIVMSHTTASGNRWTAIDNGDGSITVRHVDPEHGNDGIVIEPDVSNVLVLRPRPID